MSSTSELKRFFDADQLQKMQGRVDLTDLHKEKNRIAANIAATPILKSKKEKMPTCINCGDEHIGMCIKPKKP